MSVLCGLCNTFALEGYTTLETGPTRGICYSCALKALHWFGKKVSKLEVV